MMIKAGAVGLEWQIGGGSGKTANDKLLNKQKGANTEG